MGSRACPRRTKKVETHEKLGRFDPLPNAGRGAPKDHGARAFCRVNRRFGTRRAMQTRETGRGLTSDHVARRYTSASRWMRVT